MGGEGTELMDLPVQAIEYCSRASLAALEDHFGRSTILRTTLG